MRRINYKTLAGGFIWLSLALIFIMPKTARAQYEFTNDEAQFTTEYPGLAVQDFRGLGVIPGSDSNCTTPVNEFSDDACFSPGDVLPGIEFSAFPQGDIALLGAFVANNPFPALATDEFLDTLVIGFLNGDVKQVGIDLCCFAKGGAPCSETLNVNVFNEDDVQIGSTTVVATDECNSFLGISSDKFILRVELSGPDDIFPGVDKVLFGNRVGENVPTLSEWGMLSAAAGLGLIGLFFVARRTRAVRRAG